MQAGPYIGDQLDAATRKGGIPARAAEIVPLLEGGHLINELAARVASEATFIRPDAIAVAGNSLGGIESVLGVERETVLRRRRRDRRRGKLVEGAGATGRDDAGGAKRARADLLFQAENDFDLSPTRVLSAAMKDAGMPFETKIYPPFGTSHQDGHSFAYRGSAMSPPGAPWSNADEVIPGHRPS